MKQDIPYETPCDLSDETFSLFWSMYNLPPANWAEIIDNTEDPIRQRLTAFAEHLAFTSTIISVYSDRRAFCDEGHYDAMTDAGEADEKLAKILGYDG